MIAKTNKYNCFFPFNYFRVIEFTSTSNFILCLRRRKITNGEQEGGSLFTLGEILGTHKRSQQFSQHFQINMPIHT